MSSLGPFKTIICLPTYAETLTTKKTSKAHIRYSYGYTVFIEKRGVLFRRRPNFILNLFLQMSFDVADPYRWG